ncbi:MAG: alkaline phosphatase family protein, partial [Flavobacteriaceae bacterium]|nr:alkaline phosphatase family protein [Eudoraea sp.]NNJ39020.1 alkaline phosphatase family protein [Flavobacteriaceae bacterium]
MRIPFILLLVSGLLLSCKPIANQTDQKAAEQILNIAFGSCNKHDLENHLWDDILSLKPDLWIWGGDNIYADTDDMSVMRRMYQAQDSVPGYRKLLLNVPILGTWDDHDYGLNDGGVEFTAKAKSQQVFLDFLKVPENDVRRTRQGIYKAHDYKLDGGSVKILVLDTRYFRSPLIKDTLTNKRYIPDLSGEATVLGDEQWNWLEEQLKTSRADFNLIVSSIQFLSNEHGFECWGNFPAEVSKMEAMIAASGARGVIILSGDRHISEFSSKNIPGLPYPLLDFT